MPNSELLSSLQSVMEGYDSRADAIAQYLSGSDVADADLEAEQSFCEGTSFGLVIAIRALKCEDISSQLAEPFTAR